MQKLQRERNTDRSNERFYRYHEHYRLLYLRAQGCTEGTKVASVTSDTMTLTNAVTEDKEDMVLSIHLWKNPESPASEDYKNIEKLTM